MPTDPSAAPELPRTNRRKWLRRVGIGIGLVGVGELLWTGLGVGLLRAFGLSKGVPFRISRETTGVVEPLDAAGYPDYVGAYNAAMSHEVTPASNFQAVFRRVFSLPQLPEKLQQAYLAEGLSEAQRAAATRFQTTTAALTTLTDEQRQVVERENLDRAINAPWTDTELPELAAWLRAKAAVLDDIVLASQRPHSFVPLVASPPSRSSDSPMAACVSDTHIVEFRLAVKLLRARALQNVATRPLREGMNDLLAAARLGRNAAQQGLLISLLVGVALEAIAMEGIVVFVNKADWTKESLDEFARKLDEIPPLPTLRWTVQTGERWFALDSIVHLAQHNRQEESPLDLLTGEDAARRCASIDAGLWFGVDWDIVLREASSTFDRIDGILALEGPTAQKTAIDQFSNDLRLRGKVSSSRTVERLRPLFQSRSQTSRRTAANILIAAVPIYSGLGDAERRGLTRRRMTVIAVALKRFQVAQGHFPETLDALITQFGFMELSDPGRDSGPFGYARDETGCALTSELPTIPVTSDEDTAPGRLSIRLSR